jgi:peptidoglycan/LPS O-acetylase OafA/YrhL
VAWDIRRLGRIITRGRRFIAEVDGLRFVAISAVVLYHLSQHTLTRHMAGASVQPGESLIPKILDLGHYGVQLFFVLSGFLLALPFAKWRLGLGGKPSLRAYYLRRLTRLEPPYIVAMLLLFAGPPIVASWMSTGWSLWPNLLASLVYQHNLIFGQMSPINPVTWSLEIEVQFYMLAPALAVVFSIGNTKVRRAALFAFMLAVPLMRSFFPPWMESSYNSLLWHVEYFAAGFLLADFYLLDWQESPRHSLWWDLASLVGWPVLLAGLLEQRLSCVFAPLMLLACVGAFRGKVSSWLFSRPLVTVIGGMCYSIYLIHFRLLWATGRFAMRFLWGSSFIERFAIEALIAIPAILLVTIIFFVLLERPCMDPAWPTRATRRLHSWFGRNLGYGGEPNSEM